jgi:serine kinase of HPr protein (carbohydrate metabolism regulator)
MLLVHATTVEVEGTGVLIRGPSGSGKSDLALRLIDRGARLVADDQTEVERLDSRLMARAPAAIAGRIEVRGLGIIRLPEVSHTTLGLVVDLVPAKRVERLPEPNSVEILGISLPLLALAPFEASAAAKVRLAVVSGKMDIIPAPEPRRS